MTSANKLWFPDLVLLEDHDNDFKRYFNAVYRIFETDFIRTSPSFDGLRVGVQAHPLVDNIHRTFYHITHEGSVEDQRIPDFRRMERIRFPKFVITSCPHDDLLVWKNQRGRDTRVLVLNIEAKYLTVLTERRGYYLFWTAYYVERDHNMTKLLKEYKEYIKAKTA